MVTKLQQWVADLMDAKNARDIAPRQVTRGMHPQVWRDIRADIKSGRLMEATDVLVVDGV